MDAEKNSFDPIREKARRVASELASLASEAAVTDPALRARLESALQALRGAPVRPRNTALLSSAEDARGTVRDIVAEELARYWDRRFGGRP